MQNGNTVILSFTMKQGFFCNGVDILRSADSIHYQVIGSIEGVCGSSSWDVSYAFTDSMPQLNAKNFYRLDLKQLGLSDVRALHVFDLSDEILLYPNPVEETANLILAGDHLTAEVTVFDPAGRLYMDFKTSQKPISIDFSGLSGIYFIRVKTRDGEWVKRVWKQH
jgi:hypothetical protein